ncbi:CHAP domain-containing protein, partial [Staphylococcus capitis]
TETNTTSTSTSTQSISTSSGNLYTAGQCTWYVFDRVDGKIGSTWGNANNWASAAQAAGYTVDHQPEEGAILQTSEGSYGHVAYVESVN